MQPTPSTLSLGAHPDVHTPDGCPVEVYRRTAYHGDIDLLRPHLPAGTRVLELGCGTGVHTREMLSWGCQVTSVDNSADMLAHVPEAAQRIHGGIEALQLGARFDVVLLATHLINQSDPAVADAFVATAARHLAPQGMFLLQRFAPGWLASAQLGRQGQWQGMEVWIDTLERQPPLTHLTLRYQAADGHWLHRCTVREVEDATLAQMLHTHGFAAPTWLDAARCWAASRQR